MQLRDLRYVLYHGHTYFLKGSYIFIGKVVLPTSGSSLALHPPLRRLNGAFKQPILPGLWQGKRKRREGVGEVVITRIKFSTYSIRSRRIESAITTVKDIYKSSPAVQVYLPSLHKSQDQSRGLERILL